MRQGKRLFWQLYGYFLIIALGALAGTAWYAEHSFRQFHQEQTAVDLEKRGRLFAGNLALPLDRDPAAVDRRCKSLGTVTSTRITVILPDGRVIGDSLENVAAMENHGHRPEIATALNGRVGQSVRYSDTLNRTLMYIAIPVMHEGRVTGVVRASLPLAEIDDALDRFYRHIAWGALAVAIAFAGGAWFLSRRISRPVEYMTRVSEQFAGGDLSARVPVPDTIEMGSLARTMNQMAFQLDERSRMVAAQGNEQRAVLANMVEGVIAVDNAQRILHVNPAACALLGLKADEARGRHILETVRNIDLQEFLSELLAAPGSMEREITLLRDEEQSIQLHGTALKDGAGVGIGALVVMNDITRLKRLETLRRDFVANVSHELKTPITALKGGIETLSEVVLPDAGEAAKFLEMMGRQVGRLEGMVDDLLSLSRLEHESERGGIVLTPESVRDILARTVETFRARAEEKGILLVLDCAEPFVTPVNAPLLEQAVGNLLDNAIKYCPGETRVVVSAAAWDDRVEIRVSDRGLGIERRHHERIFERFYRVDAARSRAMGGTGLGLAIVKHIALAHRGGVAVESTPGQGSTFTIRIPRGPVA